MMILLTDAPELFAFDFDFVGDDDYLILLVVALLLVGVLWLKGYRNLQWVERHNGVLFCQKTSIAGHR